MEKLFYLEMHIFLFLLSQTYPSLFSLCCKSTTVTLKETCTRITEAHTYIRSRKRWLFLYPGTVAIFFFFEFLNNKRNYFLITLKYIFVELYEGTWVATEIDINDSIKIHKNIIEVHVVWER